LGDVDKNVVTVSVSTSHELQNGDTITLDVQPNLSVGIGTSTAVRVLYESKIDNILVNPIEFNSTGISTVTNEITITNHELVTGDKVFYDDKYFAYLKVNTGQQIGITSFTGSFNELEAIRFKPDGTKMYVTGRNKDSSAKGGFTRQINEYQLSSPWDPTTAVFKDEFDTTGSEYGEQGVSAGLYMSDDGLKFYICGPGNNNPLLGQVNQYKMTTAWDLSTAAVEPGDSTGPARLFTGNQNSSPFINNIGNGFEVLQPSDIYFKYDGTVLYIVDPIGDYIYQLNLNTPWQIRTGVSYSGDSTGRLDIDSTSGRRIHLNSSGTVLHLVNGSSSLPVTVFVYELSTPWDITTAYQVNTFPFSGAKSVYVSPDEENYYLASGDNITKFYKT